MGPLSSMMGYGSAGQTASSALGWGQVATGLDAIGDLAAGQGQSQQYRFQAQVAQNNALIAELNAQRTLAAGQSEESISKLKTGQVIGAQKAAQGANGLDVDVGSPKAVRESTANIGALDAAMIHFNAAQAAFGQQTQAANFRTQAALDELAAKGAKTASGFKALSSIISGANALSSKFSTFKLSGAMA